VETCPLATETGVSLFPGFDWWGDFNDHLCYQSCGAKYEGLATNSTPLTRGWPYYPSRHLADTLGDTDYRLLYDDTLRRCLDPEECSRDRVLGTSDGLSSYEYYEGE